MTRESGSYGRGVSEPFTSTSAKRGIRGRRWVLVDPGGLTVEGVAAFEGPIARILGEQVERLKNLEPRMRGFSSEGGARPSQ
jgi:hypothetical protein